MLKEIIFLALCFYGVQANLEHLEILNLKGWKTYAMLDSNQTKTVREESREKPRGFFGTMFGRVFGTLPKNSPQQDLDELAQIFATLNTADITTAFYLKKYCKGDGLFDPAKDPNLCEKYPEILLKQIQNRLDVINATIIRSKGTLKSPPNWLKHAISATDLLTEIDEQNRMEYRVKRAVAKIASSEKAEDEGDQPRNEPEEVSIQTERIISSRPQYEEQQQYQQPQLSQVEQQSYGKKAPCFSVQVPLQIITQPIQLPVQQVPAPSNDTVPQSAAVNNNTTQQAQENAGNGQKAQSSEFSTTNIAASTDLKTKKAEVVDSSLVKDEKIAQPIVQGTILTPEQAAQFSAPRGTVVDAQSTGPQFIIKI